MEKKQERETKKKRKNIWIVVTNLKFIPEASSHKECCADSLPLQQGVGGHSSSHTYPFDVFRRHFILQHFLQDPSNTLTTENI